MALTIYSTFTDPDLAERAAGALLDFGVRPDDISIVRSQQGVDPYAPSEGLGTSTSGQDPINRALDDRDPEVTSMGKHESTPPPDVSQIDTWQGSSGFSDDGRTYSGSYVSGEVADYDPERSAKEGISTTTVSDAEVGAAKGLGWGIGIGVVAGLASLIVPGVGLVLGGGALAIALGGLAATVGAGALSGAVVGFLKDQGMPETEAAGYRNAVRNGGAILAVSVPSGPVDEPQAREILAKYGAAQVDGYLSKGYLA